MVVRQVHADGELPRVDRRLSQTMKLHRKLLSIRIECYIKDILISSPSLPSVFPARKQDQHIASLTCTSLLVPTRVLNYPVSSLLSYCLCIEFSIFLQLAFKFISILPLVFTMRLSVVTDSDASPGVYTNLSPKSARYRVIAAAIDLALSFLETTEAQDSLKEVARVIIEKCKATPTPGLVFLASTRTRGLSQHVQRFLRSLREEFPPVYFDE